MTDSPPLQSGPFRADLEFSLWLQAKCSKFSRPKMEAQKVRLEVVLDLAGSPDSRDAGASSLSFGCKDSVDA